MNTHALPASCVRCGGEGSIDDDPWTTCPRCHGTGEESASALRAGVVAVACLAAALVGYYAPVAWWTT